LSKSTINALLDESGGSGVGDQGVDQAINHANPHHYIMGTQSSLPVDAGGQSMERAWVYNHGNLIADMLNNVVLESTGVLQKTRIYEMSSNATFRETLGFLIARDDSHQNVFAKALETLGVDWAKLFPVPNYDINKYPECRKFVEMGFHNTQFNFLLDPTRIGEILQGKSPSRNGGEFTVIHPPNEFSVPDLPEIPNEHSPGLVDMFH
jgi:Mn-containing catalase